MTATALAACFVIGLFLIFVAIGTAALLIGLIVWWLGPDDTESSYDIPAVLPENWK